jgi:hypothetical protein
MDMSLEDKLYPLLSLYDHLPHGLKRSLGFAYRQLPESFRRGKHFNEFKRLVRDGESWVPEKVAAYQL